LSLDHRPLPDPLSLPTRRSSDLSLVALDIKPGDRILTTPLTWIATAAAGVTLGAEVDFVDVDPVTHNLNAAHLEGAITPKTKARSEEHTSELQSRGHLVCRLLLE